MEAGKAQLRLVTHKGFKVIHITFDQGHQRYTVILKSDSAAAADTAVAPYLCDRSLLLAVMLSNMRESGWTGL